MAAHKIVENLLTGKDVDPQGVKRVTVTLSFVKYAELCKLAKDLGVSPSGLGKLFLEDAIESGKQQYLSSTGLDDDFDDEVSVHVDALIEAADAIV